MDSMTALAAILLSMLLVGCVLLLVKDTERRKLSERVNALSARTDADARAATPTQLQMAKLNSRPRRRIFNWASAILRFNPDVKALNVIPWRMVFLIGLVVTGAVDWAAGLWLKDGPTDMSGQGQSLLVGLGVGLITVRSIFTWERNRYRNALFQQLPDTVDLTVNSTLAGLPVSEAFRNIAESMRSPTREEFAIVCGDISVGGTVERALLRLHDRTRVSEYAIFAMVVGVQSQGGGRLTESLQHLAEMVRQRVSIGLRAKALAGEAKMSALILMILPFVAAGALSLINPGYLDPLFADPRGIRLFMVAVISLTIGGLVMRAMIQWAVGGA